MKAIGHARLYGTEGYKTPSKPLIGGVKMEQQRIFKGYIDFMDQLIDECERATLEYDIMLIHELFQ